MHITPDHAGLIAQVYPALLIAILLEGRFDRLQWKGRTSDSVFMYGSRVLALFGGMSSTLLALMVAGEYFEAAWVDWYINMSGAALFAAFASMLGLILGSDLLYIVKGSSRAEGGSQSEDKN